MMMSGYLRATREISAPGATVTGTKTSVSDGPPKIVSSLIAEASAGYQMAVVNGRAAVPCQFFLFSSVKLRVTIPTLVCGSRHELTFLRAIAAVPENCQARIIANSILKKFISPLQRTKRLRPNG